MASKKQVKNIPMPNITISAHIQDMSRNIESQTIELLHQVDFLSMHLEE